MPLVIDKNIVNKISGPVSMYLLTPKPNELFPNLPVYMLFGDEHFGTQNMCKKDDTSKGTYNIYDVNFLSLFNQLSTPENPIDFYVEGGDFHNRTFKNPDPENYPIRMVWNLYSRCYKHNGRKLALYPHEEKQCEEISNVRWQSGDIRYFKDEKYKKLLISCNILQFLESLWYINIKNLDLHAIIQALQALKKDNGDNCIEKMLRSTTSFQDIYDQIHQKGGLIYKQLEKISNEDQKKEMIRYVHNYISRMEELHGLTLQTNNSFIIKQIDNKLINLLTKLNVSTEIDMHMDMDIIESLDYLNQNFKYLEDDYRLFLFKKYSVLTDLYTLCRSFKYLGYKETVPIPIMNIIYFGSFHV